jgi:alpha-ribazole phosphatase
MSDLKATRWWWVRHAPVVDAHLLRLSGQADIAADVSDTAAFVKVAARLPNGAVWLTSPLQRTHQTMEALRQAGAERVEAAVEPAFAEQAFGDWTGCTWAELGERDDAVAFWRDPANVAPPSLEKGLASESFADQCARVAARIETLTAQYAGRDIVCIAHGGTIRAAAVLALGLTPAQALAIEVANLSLTRLDFLASDEAPKRGGNWRIVGLNQIC